jgi:glycosyltransferase involved in cell wall biosynthesis
MMPALLAWTQDEVLSRRSGYHVIADYLPAETLVAPRRDPPGGFALLRARLLRRIAFSRWCVGGSFDLEQSIRGTLRSGFQGVLHYLWCDRDFAFLDLRPRPAGICLVGTFHHPPEQLEQIIRRPKSLKLFDAIILMSETQREWFLKQGVRNERLHVILHGVDTEFYVPDSAPGPGHGMLEVLAVGATGRNFPLLREVTAHFANRTDIQWVIIGPSHESDAFEGMNNVIFRSGISDDELRICYQRAACLLHLTTHATANNVLLEALACGTPVIAQRVGGIPEYLMDECAVLTEVGDFAALVAALESFLSDPARQQQMSAAARLHASSLSWNSVALQTQSLYESLLV